MARGAAHNWFVMLAVPIGLLVLGGCEAGEESRDEGPDAVSVRLPIPVVDAAFAPYYLGIDAGIFERHGLSVTLEPGSPELNPVRMVDSGVDEFGVAGGPELIMSGQAAGAQVTGILLVHKDANFPVIIALAESGIDEIGDLEGARIGFFEGHISTDVLRAFLEQEGITYRQEDVGFNYGPLLAGQIDASWAFRTTAGITLPAQGVALNVIDPADYGIRTDGHVVFTHDRLIDERPELVQRFVDAVVESMRYTIEHPDEAVRAAVRRDPDFSPDVGTQQLRIYGPAMQRVEGRMGSFDTAALQATARRQKALGVLATGYAVGDGFTNRFVDAAPDSAVAALPFP
jgi:ABC-type nitrate/sulfonate/bicarbonate transport system substrate-binding protein